MAKILIVEDESIVGLDIQTRLERLGYEAPEVAASGEEALELAAEIRPDLALMDIMLQGDMDGVETAEIIRERFRIPVVFLTAYSDESTLQRAKISGPFGYILKPFKERELHTTIEVVLYKHQAEIKLQQAYDELEKRVEERTVQLARANEELRREVLERERAEESLQRRFEQLQVMYQLSDALARADVDETISQEALNVLQRLRQGHHSSVRLVDPGGTLAFKAWHGLSGTYRAVLENTLHWPPGEQNPQPLLIADMAREAPAHLCQPSLDENIQALACIPLVYQGRLLGDFAVYYDQPRPFDDEELKLFQGIARHIAFALARRQAEEEKIALEYQLNESQKMEALGQLAGGVAHDFNNMLTIITGYSELVLNCMRENEPLYQDIKAIHEAGERAALLTSQLLVFSRKQVSHHQILDLNAVVGKMHNMLQRVIGEDIELVSTLGPESCYVKADSSRLEQVVMNLAVNARDAMPRGGRLNIETANVEVDEAHARRHVEVQPGPYAMLRVSDTGDGMDPEVLARVFEPFFTTKSRGKGTGLGLSTVYGIVNQSGGHIDLTSRLGEGTTCEIYLPQAEAPLEPEAPVQDEPRLQKGSEIILLVEDEDVVRNMAGRILREHGYNVMEARKGEEALLLAELHEGPVHLLLTDVVMPEMSGRELAQNLCPMRPDMKVLYMSGYTDDAILRHGVQEAEMPFLQKPFLPNTLVNKVREVLDN